MRPFSSLSAAQSGLARDAVTLGMVSVASRAAMAIWGILLARALGPAQYGILSLSLATIYAAQVFADAGAANYLTREVTRRGLSGSAPLIRLASRTQLLLAVALGVVAGVGTPHHDRFGAIAGATLACVVALGMTQVSRGILRGSGHLRLEAILQLSATLGLCLLTLSLQHDLSVSAALWFYATAQIALIFGSWRVSRREGKGRTLAPQPGDPNTVLDLIRVTLPFNLLGSAAALFLRADMLLVGWLRAPADAGLYGAALQIFTGITSIGATAGIVLLPHFVKVRRDAPLALPRSVRRMTVVALAIGALVCIVTSGVRGELWRVLGSEYRDVSPIILAFAPAIPFAFVNSVLGQALLALNKERWVAWNFAALLVTAGAIYAPLISVFGGVGAAIGVSAATALSTTVQAGMLARLHWGTHEHV